MGSLRLSFILRDSGWAQLEIDDGVKKRVIESISYLSPALDDLILLGISIALDQSFAFARFFHEPGSTVLVAESGWWEQDVWKQGTRLSVFQFGDFGTADPNWNIAHETPRDWVIEIEDRDTLARAVLDMAEAVRSEWGYEEYERKWVQKPFPTRGLEALRTALATPSRLMENDAV